MQVYNAAVFMMNENPVPVVLPFYTAEEQHTLQRGSRPFSVVEILREVFKEDFHKAIQSYLDRCPEGACMALGIKDAQDFHLVRLNAPIVESSLFQPMCSTAVNLIFRAVVEAGVPYGGSHEVMETKRLTGEFRMRYNLHLFTGLCSAPMIGPASGFPKDLITEQKTAVTDQYLLPIMYAEDYAKAGQQMLKQFYPEALERVTAVDGWELSKRMDLTVKRVSFGKGSDILGQIYFDWCIVEMQDADGRKRKEKIAPMTVLINQDLCRTRAIENATLIHECCHVFLDLRFFKLQLLSGKPYRSYTNRKRRRSPFKVANGPIDWMELQAEKLPAYILMEENNTRSEIERLLSEKGGQRTPENMSYVMEKLSEIFGVTKSMAKYRMIELGYPQGEGVYSFVDQERVPDYGCAGVWNHGTTYVISRTDAGDLLARSKQFSDALKSGAYVYLEGHYCLDMRPYVELDKWRNKRLSTYARHHIEECCISFSVHGRYSNAKYEDAQAAKLKKENKDKYQSRHGFVAEPDSKNRMKENDLFTQDALLWSKLKQGLPAETGQAVQMILDEKGISQEKLSERLGVCRSALRKWCSQKMSVRHIVAICIAADVRADIGLELVRLTGYYFRNNDEDRILLGMLYETGGLTVWRANEILRQHGMQPLTEGSDAALAG